MAKIGGVSAVVTSVFGVVAAVVAGVFGLYGDNGSTPPAPAPAYSVILDCPQQQQSVIDLKNKNGDTYTFRYSGPVEDQCHLNEIAGNDVQSEQPKLPIKPTGYGGADYGGGGSGF